MQMQEGFRHLIGVHQRVWAVNQQQVDAIRRQIDQRLLSALDDMRAVGDVMAEGVLRFCGGGNPTLRDDLHAVAKCRNKLERLAECSFTQVATVNIRMIDGRDP